MKPRIMASPMPPKTIKKNSSVKRRPSQGARRVDINPRRRTVLPVEELFTKAFNLSPDPIGITDLETGRCLEVNDACLNLFGLQRDEVIGHTALMTRIWPEAQERSRLIDRVKSDGSVRNLEITVRSKREEIRQVLISVDLIGLGNKHYLVTIGHDITERKQTEEALRRSEERWQLAATGTTDGIWDWDVTGHTVFLSSRWKQVRGYREDEIGAEEGEWSSRIHPEDFSRVMATVQSYFSKEIPTFECEYRTRRKDGTYYWVNDRGIAVWDAQGQVIRMVGSESDITERKRVEAAVSRNSQLIDLSFEPIFVWEMDGAIVEWNRGSSHLYGYSSAEAVGAVSHRLLKTEFPLPLAAIEAMLQESGSWSGELRQRTRDGCEVVVESRWQLLVADEHRFVLETNRDITERKRAEEELRQLNETLEQRVAERTADLRRSNERLRAEIVERNAVELSLFKSEERLQSMLDHSPNLIFMKDLQGRYLDANTQFQQTFHLTRPDIIGKTDHDIFPPEQAATYRANDLKVIAAERSLQFEEVAVQDDGPHTSIVWKFPLRQLDGALYAICGIVTDITERRRAEEALRWNQRELQESRAQLQDLASLLLRAQDSERQRIARDLHDDFSQRLAAVTLDVAALKRNPPLMPELLSNALEPVREELAQLANDLRQLAHRLHPSLLKHAGLQAALEEFVQHAMQRTGLQITLKVNNMPDSLPRDLTMCLFRVCQESLQNVAKHAKATDVLVKLSGSSRIIGLSVTDNGTGFDAQDKSGHQKGMGLISMQERLRLLNGCLNIHSRAANGTKVCAWIPLQEKKL